MRIGIGYDVHRLVPQRPLILGGVKIPYKKGLLGHSDADVLLHAIMDALLGAAALGDIGKHFPATDPAYKDSDSLELLDWVYRMLLAKNYSLINLDAVVIAEEPVLSPYVPAMIEKIAKTLAVGEDQVNIKATTTEGMGFSGRKEGIAAAAVVLLG